MTVLNLNKLDDFSQIIAASVRNGSWSIEECRQSLGDTLRMHKISCTVDRLDWDRSTDRITAYLSDFRDVDSDDVEQFCSQIQEAIHSVIRIEPSEPPAEN